MSFIEDLNNKLKARGAATPRVAGIPINLPESSGGLSGTYREPYRVNGPLNAVTAPATRSRMQLIPQPTEAYRG